MDFEAFQKLGFRVRFGVAGRGRAVARSAYWRALGMRIGKGTHLERVHATWPHQVSLGERCLVEHDVYFKFDGPWRPGPSIRVGDHTFVGSGTEFNIRASVEIGEDGLIASGCRFIDHDHGMALGEPMRLQPGFEAPIRIGRDVWVGANAVVLAGVTVGDGAVIAASAVVRCDVPSNEIWGGVPARRLRSRA